MPETTLSALDATESIDRRVPFSRSEGRGRDMVVVVVVVLQQQDSKERARRGTCCGEERPWTLYESGILETLSAVHAAIWGSRGSVDLTSGRSRFEEETIRGPNNWTETTNGRPGRVQDSTVAGEALQKVPQSVRRNGGTHILKCRRRQAGNPAHPALCLCFPVNNAS